jgi:Ca-activated chloride channel homolog
MFRFEHPEFFVAFLAIPLLLTVYFVMLWFRSRSSKSFATRKAWSRLTDQWSRGRERMKAILLLSSFILLGVALANPQWGLRRETVMSKAADIFIALDISNSMLARDIAPSRLERSKRFAQRLVDAFKGDRIGLIIFAGNAYLQMPLTTDYASAELFIRSAHPRLATSQGTAIGDAIELAMRAYEEDAPHHKALFLITDGENHEEGALEEMRKGRETGLVPFIISVGTTEGDFIPMEVDGREDYKRDENGNPVRTAVNEAFLRQLAQEGDGQLYSILDGQNVIDDMKLKMQGLEKREMEQRAFKDYKSYFQYFLLGAILLLFAERIIGNKRRIKQL